MSKEIEVKNCHKCAHCDGLGFCHHWHLNIDKFDDGFVRCCEYKEKEGKT